MHKRLGLLLCCAMLAVTAMAQADQRPTYRGPVSQSEKQFVSSIQADLMKRFATAKDAEKAGYFRYTNEDPTGAISYANLKWNSTDIQHPSQLWYDKNGHLLGADFSVPYKAGDPRPKLFGVNPGRWYEFDDHIHWVTTAAGKSAYDNYIYPGPFKAAGGDPARPSADTLVKLHKVQKSSQVAHVFDMPGIWDLIVWVKPNPNGAFAAKNPTVKP